MLLLLLCQVGCFEKEEGVSVRTEWGRGVVFILLFSDAKASP